MAETKNDRILKDRVSSMQSSPFAGITRIRFKGSGLSNPSQLHTQPPSDEMSLCNKDLKMQSLLFFMM